MHGGGKEEREAERARYAAQHAEDAQAQAEWERRAQSAWEADEHDALGHLPSLAREGPKGGGSEARSYPGGMASTGGALESPDNPKHRPPDTIKYLSSLKSEEDIIAALLRDAESEDY